MINNVGLFQFDNGQFPPDSETINRMDHVYDYNEEDEHIGEVFEITGRHIIDPPPRPKCKPCYRLDPHNKCRKIIGCTS